MKTIESLGCGQYAGAAYLRVNTVNLLGSSFEFFPAHANCVRHSHQTAYRMRSSIFFCFVLFFFLRKICASPWFENVLISLLIGLCRVTFSYFCFLVQISINISICLHRNFVIFPWENSAPLSKIGPYAYAWRSTAVLAYWSSQTAAPFPTPPLLPPIPPPKKASLEISDFLDPCLLNFYSLTFCKEYSQYSIA